MQTQVSERFREEARRFVLRFTCEWCVHFDWERQRCVNGFPTSPHHRVDLARVKQLAFCKTFELY